MSTVMTGAPARRWDYKQVRCINLAKRGLLALNLEWVGMGQLNTPGFSHYKINQLDLLGTSGIAVHYLAQSRAIDLMLEHPKRRSGTDRGYRAFGRRMADDIHQLAR